MNQKLDTRRVQIAVKKINGLMSNVMDNMADIARIIYEENCADESGMAMYEIHKGIPELSMSIIGKLLLVGKGDMDIRCFTYSCPAIRAIEKLNGQAQKTIFNSGEVEVVKVIDNKAIVSMRPINDLTAQEAGIAFDEVGKRPIEQQKKLLVEKVQDIRSHQPAQTYEIDKNGNLIILVATTIFTPAQLEDIIARMKAAQLKTIATKKAA